MQVTTTTPLFAATLRPDRSMRPTGGWFALGLAFLITAPVFLALPEFLVTGAAVFALGGGGLLVYGRRMSRQYARSQSITLWPDQLEITDMVAGQKKQMRRFSPHNVRLNLSRDGNERTVRIVLRHEDERVEIGGFLSVDDKGSFAKAFGAALRKARRS